MQSEGKARLCVGGQRDPDLKVRELAVDVPTASRHSVLIGLQVALTRAWLVSIGDIRAGFLNGVAAAQQLYLKQPGIFVGLQPGQLIEILTTCVASLFHKSFSGFIFPTDLIRFEILIEKNQDSVNDQNWRSRTKRKPLNGHRSARHHSWVKTFYVRHDKVTTRRKYRNSLEAKLGEEEQSLWNAKHEQLGPDFVHLLENTEPHTLYRPDL